MSWDWISIFSYSDLDLDHRRLGSNPKLRLDVSYLYTKFYRELLRIYVCDVMGDDVALDVVV